MELLNPFRAPKPLPILKPSNFVSQKRVSSCKVTGISFFFCEVDVLWTWAMGAVVGFIFHFAKNCFFLGGGVKKGMKLLKR